MGKNLKGRECGKSIYQRKDGKYSARYYAKDAGFGLYQFPNRRDKQEQLL